MSTVPLFAVRPLSGNRLRPYVHECKAYAGPAKRVLAGFSDMSSPTHTEAAWRATTDALGWGGLRKRSEYPPLK